MTHPASSSTSVVPRKNPLLRTPQMNLPPEGRSRIAHGLTEAAAIGAGLRLQCCADCGTTQYPPQTTCVKCLSAKVRWTRQSGLGELLTSTTLEHSNHLYFKERLPWRIGSVRLDNGPCVIAFLTDSVTETSPRVRLSLRLDRAGQAVVIAQPESEQDMHPQEKLQKETGCSPDHRKVLVTDGKSVVGQALVRALLKAGADTVWVGHAEPWKPLPGVAEIAQLPGVEMVPLDVTDTISVTRLGAEIGHKVDILINNAEVHRTHGISSRRGTEIARAEMEINYLGLLRLAQASLDLVDTCAVLLLGDGVAVEQQAQGQRAYAEHVLADLPDRNHAGQPVAVDLFGLLAHAGHLHQRERPQRKHQQRHQAKSQTGPWRNVQTSQAHLPVPSKSAASVMQLTCLLEGIGP